MFYVFIIGLCVGSFINSFVFRLKTGESILWSRSHCPACKKILKWHDLMPILSFLILRGKCRYCRKKISWQYPVVELTTALLFLLVNYHLSFVTINYSMGFLGSFRLLGMTLRVTYYLLLITFLIIIFLSDLKYYIIPDRIIYPAIVLAFGVLVIESWNLFGNWKLSARGEISPLWGGEIGNSNLFYALLAAILPALFFFSLVALSKGKWMGVGDIKLVFFMGLVLGWPNILAALFLSFVSGAVAGLILIAAKKKTMKSEIPFGTFLSAATLIALLWGDKMIEWYWGLLL